MMTAMAKPLIKIAIFLTQPTSGNASANTRLLEQSHQKLLISLSSPGLPRPTPAKKLVKLRGSPKGMKTHPVFPPSSPSPPPQLKVVVDPEPDHIIRLGYFSGSQFNQLGFFLK